jgi:hypothetical protein
MAVSVVPARRSRRGEERRMKKKREKKGVKVEDWEPLSRAREFDVCFFFSFFKKHFFFYF